MPTVSLWKSDKPVSIIEVFICEDKINTCRIIGAFKASRVISQAFQVITFQN